MKKAVPAQQYCPIPQPHEMITMAHGGGGRRMQDLIEKLIIPAFDNTYLQQRQDSAVFELAQSRLAFTTDAYVVMPLFFPGGDIGKLAVCGTLNDLAVTGARPVFLSCSLILEEGLPIETLQKVINSMADTAKAAGVSIVTGDCKVVDKGKGDGLYINTSGVGIIEHALPIVPAAMQENDVVIVNGDLGRHSIAIMAAREGLSFETTIESDCADISGLIKQLLNAGVEIHCMRDLTRGGLSSALNELAQTAKQTIEIDEQCINVSASVQGACEILGLDPLYLANEGRFVLVLPEAEVSLAMEILQSHPLGKGAAVIGHVAENQEIPLILKTRLGTKRILDLLNGDQLPRIC